MSKIEARRVCVRSDSQSHSPCNFESVPEWSDVAARYFPQIKGPLDWPLLIFAYHGFLHERNTAQTPDIDIGPAAKAGV